MGLGLKGPDGKLMMLDDERLNPLWETLVDLKLVLIAHVADPANFWLPFDETNPSYEALKRHPDWHFGKPGLPSREELFEARNRLHHRFPQLTIVNCHFGGYAPDMWFLEILDRAGIEILFWCYGEPKLAGPSRVVVRADEFAGKERGMVTNAAALKAAFDAWIAEKVQALKPVSLKVGSAYSRDMLFAQRSEREVDSALLAAYPKTCYAQVPALSDYVHQLIAEACARTGIPMQVHTGILAGNTFPHPLAETYVARFEGFIARNPATKFDIFHGSFPQWGEAVSMARRYSNVWLNTCWVPTLSESMCEAMLHAALDSVPVNKILWGGDSHSLEMAYGVLRLFRGVVERVLAARKLKPQVARDAAEWILHRSAAHLYGLSV